MEVYTGYSGHSSDSVNHRAKRMGAARGRSDVTVSSVNHRPQKNAIRICGDWSEQLSSKGKIYFYNCITEVSQWQKPPEWKLPDMDHDELIRLLSSREHAEGKSVKRSRISTSSATNTKEETHLSPKRGKYSNEWRNKNPSTTRRLSPSTLMGNVRHGSDPNRLSSQRPNSNSHSSPKRNHDRKLYAAVPTHNSVSSNGPMKLNPTDDMDISPNSSPMSGCSGSSRSATNNLSPHFSKHLKTDYCYDPLSRNTDSSILRETDPYDNNSTKEEKPGTLRHLVDAIRASIGGLLGQPSFNSNSVEPVSLKNNFDGRAVHSTKNESHYATDRRYRNSPRESAECGKGHHFWSPKPRSTDSSGFGSQNDVKRSISHPSPLLTNTSQAQSRLDMQTKDVPGLVSTLTTLVNLIGNAKYQSTSASNVSSTSNSLLSTPQVPTQRTPSSYQLPTPQRRCSAISPAMPSPLTPMQNSASSSATALAQSLLESNLPSHQMNHLLSSLESLAQQARCKQSKPLLPHPPSGDRHDPVICPDYSDRGRGSPCRVEQNSTEAPVLSKLRDDVSSASIYPGDDRFRGSPVVHGHQRHFSGSHFDDRSLRTPTRPEGSRDFQPPRGPQPGPSTAPCPLSGSSSSVPVSGAGGFLDPHINRSAGPPSSSPDEKPPEDECLSKITRLLGSPTTQSFVDPTICAKFTDKALDRLEQEALVESRKFEKLQSVLYGELSVESKKLRALVRISEAKLAIHREKQTSLQELMDAIETRRQLPNLSFSDDVI